MSQTLRVRNGILPRVRTFCPGVFDKGTPDEAVCTEQNILEVVRNFKILSMGENPLHRPAIAKGHEESGADLTKRTDQPAWGWVVDCYAEKEAGKLWLYTDWKGIPAEAEEKINSGEYRFVSPEFYRHPSEGNLPGEGWCLRRVVMLGATPPRNKQLGQLVPLAFSDRLDLPYRRVNRYKGAVGPLARVLCFAEGVMDRAALEEQLRGIGFGDAQIEALKGLPDDAFQAFVLATLAAKAGAPAEQPAATAAAEMDPAAMPSREDMITALVEKGEDRAALDAMTDEQLWALYQEKVMATVAASEPNKPTPGAPQPKQIIHKFAEPTEVKALRATVAGLQKQTALLFSERELERKATRKNTVDALCSRWVKEGFVLPGDVDPKSSTPNLYHRLMHADGGQALKFGEKSMTAFDAAVAEIEARGPGYVSRFFSEKIADPAQTKNVHEQARARIAERYGVSNNKAPSLEERLGMLKPAHQR